MEALRTENKDEDMEEKVKVEEVGKTGGRQGRNYREKGGRVGGRKEGKGDLSRICRKGGNKHEGWREKEGRVGSSKEGRRKGILGEVRWETKGGKGVLGRGKRGHMGNEGKEGQVIWVGSGEVIKGRHPSKGSNRWSRVRRGPTGLLIL